MPRSEGGGTGGGEANGVGSIVKRRGGGGGGGRGGGMGWGVGGGRDSLVGIAYVLQLMAATGKTVSQLVADIPRYEIVKTKFACRREDAERAVEAGEGAFLHEKVGTQGGGWVVWPKAGGDGRGRDTEAIMRIIAEAPDRATAEKKIADVQTVVDETLKQPVR